MVDLIEVDGDPTMPRAEEVGVVGTQEDVEVIVGRDG